MIKSQRMRWAGDVTRMGDKCIPSFFLQLFVRREYLLCGPNPSPPENKFYSVVIAVDCTGARVAVPWLNTSQSLISQNTQIDSSTHTKGPMNRTRDHNIAMTTSQVNTRTENYVAFHASFSYLFLLTQCVM